MLARKALAGTAGAPKVYVEDVFSTQLYTSTGGDVTVTNGIDLSGKGGLVWIKARNQAFDHYLTDTVRGAGRVLYSNLSNAQSSPGGGGASSFSSTGYVDGNQNANGTLQASWTFRKAEKFFDVVTYTGNGSARTISHNLGSTPGFLIIKKTSASGDNWVAWHRSAATSNPGYHGYLNTTADFVTAPTDALNWTNPTSTVFSVGTAATTNQNGATYVAYLFAHDAGGFGLTGSDNVISCGSFSYSSGFTSYSLGYEPQWIMVKRTNSTGNWFITDIMRGAANDATNDNQLIPNSSAAEAASFSCYPTATGFTIEGLPAGDYIYIAIRRGPMKTPETGTSVFNPVVYTGTNVDNRLINTTIAPDMVMIRQRDDSVVDGVYVGNRLTGDEYLLTGTTDAAASDLDSFMTPTSGYGNAFSAMNGVGVGNDATRKFNANTTSNNHVIWAFKRAPKFFDVVCYTGDGTTNRSISHNLGVAPELMILKIRSTTGNWFAYVPSGNIRMALNVVNASPVFSGGLSGTTPTSTTFSLGNDTDVNANASTYIAYLFASLTGVSKIGTYTGNGSSQTINCGFAAGARFVFIKITGDAGSWYVFDTARGIVSGNDPWLTFNNDIGEITAYDALDPDNSGFIVNNSNTLYPLNVTDQTYLYLAIA